MNSKIKLFILISIFSLYSCQDKKDECKLIKEKLVCSTIPAECPVLGCEQLKEINFDSNIRKLESESFSNYELKDELTINFANSNMMTIESDAFNGLVLHSNAQLNINILNLDFINNNNNNNNNEKHVKSNLIFEKNALRGMLIEIGAKLTIRIRNFDLVEFKYNSILNQLKQFDQSQVLILIEDSTDVVFRGGNANLIRKSSDPLALLGNNLLSSQFKINIHKCKDIVFEKESFASQTQTPSSLFQLTATQFDDCRLGRLSFSQLQQSESAYFELNLSGKRLTLSEQTFSSMKQNTNSQFIMFTNLSESNSVCIKPQTFAYITQGLNSTVRISFQLNHQNDFVMHQQAIYNLKQNVTSHFQMYVLKPINVQLETEAVTSLEQNTLSNFELWVNKAKANFVLDQSAFTKINQAKESTIRLGYMSSQTADSVYYQSPNAFYQLVSDSNSQVIYDFSPGTKFSLKYAARPMPRIMPNIKNSNLTMEEQLYKMFPNLGRQSRPDLLNLNEFKLEANDFCSISDIPFDVLVKLRPDTDCSCSVYYLYRSIRKIRNETDQWILNAPECYQKKMLNNDLGMKSNTNGLNEMNNLNELETMCKFKEMIANCKSMEGLKMPTNNKAVNSSQLKECENSFDYFESAQKSSNDETYEIYEDDTYPDDKTNENAKDSIFDNFTYEDEEEDEENDNENENEIKHNDENDKIDISKDYSDYIYDSDDDDEEGINDDDDENDNENNIFDKDGNLIEEINVETSSISSLPIVPKQIDSNNNETLKLTKWHILLISGLSMLLIGILISVIIIACRLRRRRRGDKSLSANDEEFSSDDDDDEEDDDDQHDLVSHNMKSESIFKPITKQLKKQTKKFAYSHFNQQSNSALSNLIENNNNNNDTVYSINKNSNNLFVKCDRNNSVVSSLTSSTTTLNSSSNNYTVSESKNENNRPIYKQMKKSGSELSLEDKIKINYNIYN